MTASWIAALPTPSLPVAFALIWLAGVWTTEGLKTAKGKTWRALFALANHAAFWALGVIFMIELFLHR